MKMCGCCDEPIREGERFTTHDILSPTNAGWTVYLHVDPCKKVPIQTSQISLRH